MLARNRCHVGTAVSIKKSAQITVSLRAVVIVARVCSEGVIRNALGITEVGPLYGQTLRRRLTVVPRLSSADRTTIGRAETDSIAMVMMRHRRECQQQHLGSKDSKHRYFISNRTHSKQVSLQMYVFSDKTIVHFACFAPQSVS